MNELGYAEKPRIYKKTISIAVTTIAIIGILLAVIFALPKTGIQIELNPFSKIFQTSNYEAGNFNEAIKQNQNSGIAGYNPNPGIANDSNSNQHNQDSADSENQGKSNVQASFSQGQNGTPEAENDSTKHSEGFNNYLKKKAGKTGLEQTELPTPNTGKENILPEDKLSQELKEILESTGNEEQGKPERIRVIVEAKEEKDLERIASLAGELGATEIEKHEIGDLVSLEINPAELEKLAEENTAVFISPDKELSLLLDESPTQINASNTPSNNLLFPTGKGIRIAVIDTGIESSHDMLRGRIALEKDFTGQENPSDEHGHGTHVAGIIAGSKANGGMFSGIAPKSEIINAKALNRYGQGTDTQVINAINWAIDPDGNPLTNDGAKIINLSLGGAYYEPGSPLERTIQDAINKGVLVVASAGNCSAENPSLSCNGFIGVTTPASSPYALAVGAVDKNNNWASFSSGEIIPNTGIKPDVTAPGVDIESAWLGNTYSHQTGTSMAAPFVSGLAALLLEANPSLTPFELKAIIEENTLDLGAAGKDIKYGSGLIDANKAINASLQSNPDFGLEVFSSSFIRTGVNQQVAGRISLHNDTNTEIKVNEILAEPWIYYSLEKNPLPSGESTFINFEFHPSSIGIGNHEAQIILAANSTLITHTLYTEVVPETIDQNIDRNISIQVGTIGAVYVNGVYVLSDPAPKVFPGTNMEFRIYLTNSLGPSRQYSATVKVLNPSGTQICDLGYQTDYVNMGTSKQLYYYYPLATGAAKGMYKINAEAWQNCTGSPYDGTCKAPGSYTCSYNHNNRTPNAFEAMEYCSSGACCDTANNWLKPSTFMCASNMASEKRCTGTAKGSDIEIRYKNRYCSGASNLCNGNETWGNWQLQTDCPTTNYCDATTFTCIPDPVLCRANSECGATGWEGGITCGANGNAYRDYVTRTCVNPGTTQSYCATPVTENRQWEDCTTGEECITGTGCRTSYSDQCANHEEYRCSGPDLWHCGVDPLLLGHYNDFLVNSCNAKTDCWTSIDNKDGACLDKLLSIGFDYAPTGTMVYKQAGDNLLLRLDAKQAMTVNIDYDNATFTPLDGCAKGQMALMTGEKTCKFTINKNSLPRTYFFTLTYNGNSTTRGIKVINNPKIVIATNRQKLEQRFSDPQGVKSLLENAYTYAAENRGIVYDLGLYDFAIAHPFQSFTSYFQDPNNPSKASNSYAAQASSFLKQRCPIGTCKHTLILGDDYVVPHYRESNGRGPLSDYAYTRTTSKAISETGEISRDAVFIVPAGMTGELRSFVDLVKQEFTDLFSSPQEIIINSTSDCTQDFFRSISEKNVVIIGDRTNNKVFLCNTWFMSDELTSYSVRANPWHDNQYTIYGAYLIGIKQSSLTEAEDGLVVFYQKIKKKGIDLSENNNTEFIAACIGLNDAQNLGDTAMNLACNITPVVELGPDIIDTTRCLNDQLFNSASIAEHIICAIVHAATAYDVVTLIAAVASKGALLGIFEGGDTGLSTLKVALVGATSSLPKKILLEAEKTFISSPRLVKTMAEFIFKRTDDVIESTKTFFEIAALGSETIETTLKMLDDFGELALKNIESLGRAVKGLGAETWTQTEKQGLHKYIGLSPEEQGDAIMVAMRKSGEFDDSLAKQAIELNPNGTLKNVEFKKFLPDGKDADNFISVEGKDYWIDSTEIQDELISEQNLYGKLLSDSRRYKFESLGSGGIQIIELEKGTKLTKTQIESTIREALPQMLGTSKIKVYDAITGEVFWG